MEKKINQMVESIYDLTPLQKGMLYHNMMDDAVTAYVLQNVLKIRGKFQKECMKTSLKLLTYKYEVLRTLILYRSVDVPKQVVLKERECEYTVTDLSEDEDEAASEKLEILIQADVKRGFDLEKDTLMRVNIVTMGNDITYMIITNHHICMDGWCTSFLLHDMLDYYERLSEGEPVHSLAQEMERDRGTVAPYRDFVEYIREQDEKEGLNYWEELLRGYEETAVVVPYETPMIQEQSSGIAEIKLEEPASEKVKDFAKNCGVTLSLLFETAWAILLMKYNRTTDVVFGKVVSGRQKNLKGIEKAVGLYINTIPVRYSVREGQTVKELLTEAFRHELDSFPYDYCSLSEIQQRTNLPSNLIDSIFVFENYYVQYEYDEKMQFADLTYEIVRAREQTNYPISVGAFASGEHIRFGMMYDKSRFTEENAKRLCLQLEQIVFNMISDPDASVCDLNFITASEEADILHKFNRQPDFSCGRETVVDLFENCAKQFADNIALKYKNQQVTYARLNAMANQIAEALRKIGVGPEDPIVIIGRKSPEIVTGILGILKSGGCYVPIDVDEPQERLAYKLKDCNPKVILIQDAGVKTETDKPILDLSAFLCQETAAENPTPKAGPENLAYIIYTSGTTGNPKGVMIEHGSAVNFCKAMGDEYQIGPTDRMILFASITFDASTGQILLALTRGAMLSIPDSDLSSDPEYIHDIMEQEKLNVLSFPPQFAGQLPETDCRYILTAGSEASREVVQKIISYADYINAYGPTEATICATYWSCKKGAELPAKIPIGKPHRNYTVYLLDRGSLCGIGVPGELAIGGAGLSRGYLNRKDLTEEKFVPNPFGEGRLYLTGDLARWLPDGNIEYLGRMDDQVKIRGYRIELSEVEDALRKIQGVEDTAAIVVRNNHGDQCIAAYVVSREALDLSVIRRSVAEHVPVYMVPDYIIQLERIPVTINGKIDKAELRSKVRFQQREYEPPQNETEKKICEVFERVLGAERIGINDPFIDYGGNSINAIRLIALLGKEDIHISIGDAVSLQTPKRIAALIADTEKNESGKVRFAEDAVRLTEVQQLNAGLSNPFCILLLAHAGNIQSEAVNAALKELSRLHPIFGYRLEAKACFKKSSLPLRCQTISDETDNKNEQFETAIWPKLAEDTDKPLSVMQINAKAKNYILFAFHKAFLDEYSKLVVIDEFINYYNEYTVYADMIHRDSREQVEYDFIDWASARHRRDGGMAAKTLDFRYSCAVSDEIADKLCTTGTWMETMQVILEEALSIYQKKTAKIAFVGNLFEEAERRARFVGQYSTIQLLKAEEDADATFSISYEDGCEFRAKNSGFTFINLHSRTVAGIAALHMNLIVRGRNSRLRFYAEQDLTEEDIKEISRLVQNRMEKYLNSLKGGCTPDFDETSIREEFAGTLAQESFCVEREYAVQTRQKFFLESNYSSVCVGKWIVTGSFSRQYCEAAVNRVRRHQSVFRSVFNDSHTTIQELQYMNDTKIPFFDLSAVAMEAKCKTLTRIEKMGTDVSRFDELGPLAQQCIVKISEELHVIYLFAHHAVCDMVSVHIWNREIRDSFYNQCSLAGECRYSDFVPEDETKREQIDTQSGISQYTKRFGGIENDAELSLVSRDPKVRKKIEASPSALLLSILDKMLAVYNEGYQGNVPFLFVYHGRNDKNEGTMGLFIDAFRFMYRHGDADSICSAVKSVSNLHESHEKVNLMNGDELAITSHLYCPLINIVTAQADYVPEILTGMLTSEGGKTHELEFQGISIELQFFNDAVKLMLKCSKEHESAILELCAAAFDQNAVVESCLL